MIKQLLEYGQNWNSYTWQIIYMASVLLNNSCIDSSLRKEGILRCMLVNLKIFVLLNLEVMVEEEEKTILLLIFLTISYNHLMTILTLGKKTIWVDDAKIAFFFAEKMKEGKEEKSKEETLATMKSGRLKRKDKLLPSRRGLYPQQ